jgi:hypothetical protein
MAYLVFQIVYSCCCHSRAEYNYIMCCSYYILQRSLTCRTATSFRLHCAFCTKWDNNEYMQGGFALSVAFSVQFNIIFCEFEKKEMCFVRIGAHMKHVLSININFHKVYEFIYNIFIW